MPKRIVSHEEWLDTNKPGAADRLSLAAAPTFAGMALLTAFGGNGPAEIVCSTGHGASPLTGMAAMYLLMSAFHLTPWLKLISSRRRLRQP